MSGYDSFGYPYPYWSPGWGGPQTDPQFTRTPTPQISYGPITTGEFVLVIVQNTTVDVATSTRFSIAFQHILDGIIQPNNVALNILDGNGVTTGSAAPYFITKGTVSADPATSGGYFCVVQLTANTPPGYYEAVWTGTYTPINNQEPNVPLPISSPRIPFWIRKQNAPSKYYLVRTDQI
jgi:hypothetical protein